MEEVQKWYAAKVHYNRVNPLVSQLKQTNTECYVPEIIPSLLFIHTTEDYLKQFELSNFSRLWVYRDKSSGRPSVIPEKEMEVFIFVCSSGKDGLTYLGEDKPAYHQGAKVRVIDGPFKGAEGHIKRIKKDRRLVVSVRGVAAVVTTYIHPQFLEVISE